MIRFLFGLSLLLVAVPSASAQANPPDGATATNFDLTLQEAYSKEYAFLVGQQRQLEKRRETLDKRHQTERDGLQSELSRLENRLISVDGRLQDAREELQQIERAAEFSTDDQQLIRATLEQAASSLSDYGRSIVVPEDDQTLPEVAVDVFAAAAEVLEARSSIRTESDAEFFLSSGSKVQGTVVRVGEIAAYGVSESGAGALAPAGGGKLKVWKDDAASSARALASSETPETLGVFLYESLDTAIDDDAEESLLEHVSSGGAIAWVIVVLGILGVLLAAARALVLYSCRGSSEELEARLGQSARHGDADAVLSGAKRIKGSPARVTASVFRSIREGSERVDEAISEGLIGEGRRLQLFGTAILVIAAVSPLLGLLGTVTGMISTFDVITKFGTGDPKMLSGGISTALITTELGLIVAIPTLLLGNLLKGWSDRIEAESERSAIRMVSLYSGKPVAVLVPPAERRVEELSPPVARASE